MRLVGAGVPPAHSRRPGSSDFPGSGSWSRMASGPAVDRRRARPGHRDSWRRARADGGYRAVLLLDGDRMAARESLRVGEDCLRWWSNATALAARGAPTYLVGVGGALAVRPSTWRQADYARAELADRRRSTISAGGARRVGDRVLEAVAAAVDAAPGSAQADVLGPVDTGAGTVRTLLRFDYGSGAAVAGDLRAEVIRCATARRRTLASKAAGAPPVGLRVRIDDVEPFESGL